MVFNVLLIKNGGAFWRGPDRQALHRRGSLLVGTISPNLLNQQHSMIRNHTAFLAIRPQTEWPGKDKIVVKSDWRGATPRRGWEARGTAHGLSISPTLRCASSSAEIG